MPLLHGVLDVFVFEAKVSLQLLPTGLNGS